MTTAVPPTPHEKELQSIQSRIDAGNPAPEGGNPPENKESAPPVNVERSKIFEEELVARSGGRFKNWESVPQETFEEALEKRSEGKYKKWEEIKFDGTPSKSIDELIAEKTEGRFSKWDDIHSRLNEPKEEFASETVKKINDYIKGGGKLDANWIRLQTADYDQMKDPKDLFFEKKKIDIPGISQEELEYEYENTYKLSEWTPDDDTAQARAMKAKLTREANEARDFLKEHQKKLSVAPNTRTPEQIAQEAIQRKAQQDQWSAHVEDNLREFKALKLAVHENETVDFEVSKEFIKEHSEIVKELPFTSEKFFAKFLTKEGVLDVKKFADFAFKAENFDKAVAKAAEESYKLGVKNVVKEMKNPDFKPDGQPSGQQEEAKSVHEQVSEQSRQRAYA